MPYKNNIKQRNKSFQGLRSFKDTLPTSVKKIIKKKGHVYSETLNNWKSIVGYKLFKTCFPKSFKNSNKFGDSTLFVMVQRGQEINLEYSKKEIIDNMNNYFGYNVVKKIKLVSFDNSLMKSKQQISKNDNVTNSNHFNKIIEIKNDKVKKSLIELSKILSKK